MGRPAGRGVASGGPLGSAGPARPPSERRQVRAFSLFPVRPERISGKERIKTRLVCKSLSLQTCLSAGLRDGRQTRVGHRPGVTPQPRRQDWPPLHLGARSESPLGKA